MTNKNRNVKATARKGRTGAEVGRTPSGRWYARIWRDCIEFVDAHPRSGWFLTALMGFDVVLHLLELFAV